VLIFDDTDLLIPDADGLDPMNQLEGEEDDKSTSDGVENLLNNDINLNTGASDANTADNDSKQTEKNA
jgi:hypothetical protein